MLLVRVLAVFLSVVAALAVWQPGSAATTVASEESIAVTRPDQEQVSHLFGGRQSLRISRRENPVPGWLVSSANVSIGFIASSWEVVRSVGYSGRPIDILVAVDRKGHIAGAELVRHNEPILTLGISTADIRRYVDEFSGIDLVSAAAGKPGELPDIISGATVSTGVIRDAILRTAQIVTSQSAIAQRTGSGIDRVSYEPLPWRMLETEGAIVATTVKLDEARTALSTAKNQVPDGEAAFLDLRVAVIDPPTIGANLLGQADFTRIMAALAPGESALLVASRGLHSHRGTAWRRSDIFDRVEITQGNRVFKPDADHYQRIDKLAIEDAPAFKEISVFALPAEQFDPAQPFQVAVLASRKTADGGNVEMRIPVDYTLPPRFLSQATAVQQAPPLWVSSWQNKRLEIAGVLVMLTALGAILFLQSAFVKRPRLWRWGRAAFLTVTLVWLGWIAGGQLSVVQVVAFLQSLVNGFQWETFLIEPVIFILWGFVALGLLFWGRGVYCGWLCPFGALQELTNIVAQRLRVPQIAVPFVVQERLWAIKYTLFVIILGLSFYSVEQAQMLAEAEPFKTAMTMRFMRAWPFVLFAVALLVAGLFIERFYCRYLCPLGAALAIPAKLKLFDWLRRRSQCGRECRLCEQKCTVGAIDPIGRINPNECVLCLRCQVIYHDPSTCTILKRRATRSARPVQQKGAS
ncbi:4Fe-4S binding protein [Hoeflea sp. TYP-13]|uniref:4Fe-4S binding protein n=1 Tax=Hoeflea sp. TYP-13 TaxID=3230023 RepID=UPI0034C5CFAD